MPIYSQPYLNIKGMHILQIFSKIIDLKYKERIMLIYCSYQIGIFLCDNVFFVLIEPLLSSKTRTFKFCMYNMAQKNLALRPVSQTAGAQLPKEVTKKISCFVVISK